MEAMVTKRACPKCGLDDVPSAEQYIDEDGAEGCHRGCWVRTVARRVPSDALILACAEAAHETNRIYCVVTGDDSQVPWRDAPPWQQRSALRGVSVALAGHTPEESHDAWCAEKADEGWTYGPVKDPENKKHPCLVSYNNLPTAQRAKDTLYLAVVRSMAAALAQ